MKKIFLIFILTTSLYQCQKNNCPDTKNFFIRNDLVYSKNINISEFVEKNNGKRFILIKDGTKCIANYKSILSTAEVEGYATNFIKKMKDGFYYSFEYGNRYHYEYEVYFKYLKGNFYLYKIVQKFYDMANPNSLKTKSYTVQKVKFELFDIHNYLPE